MRKLLFLTIIISTFTSCTQYRYIYSASKVNTPMLTKKNDSRINGSFSFGNAKGGRGDSSKNLGYDIQGAFAFTKHVAVLGSVYKRWEADVFGDSAFEYTAPFHFSHINYKRDFYELGIGYFGAVEKDIILSVYGGIGKGRVNIRDTGITKTNTYQRQFSTKAFKYFIQPGISFEDKVDFSIRFSYLEYQKINSNYQNNELEVLHMSRLGSHGQLFVEPSVTWQIPVTEWFRVEGAFSMALHNSERYARLWSMSTGLTFNPTRALRKNSK